MPAQTKLRHVPHWRALIDIMSSDKRTDTTCAGTLETLQQANNAETSSASGQNPYC